jgi:hypothetical protein
MKLEWFRRHKQFVYWILLPTVGVSMVGFGAYNFWLYAKGGGNTARGPSVAFKLGGVSKNLSPGEVVSLRTALTLYDRGGHVDTATAAEHAAKTAMAKAAGFELGSEEEAETVVRTATHEMQSRDPSDDIVFNSKTYHDLLQNMQLTAQQFEQITHDKLVTKKYQQCLAQQVKVSDDQVFIDYCREKETVRLRYTSFKSESRMDRAVVPMEKEIKDFYDANKDYNKEPPPVAKGQRPPPPIDKKLMEALLASKPQLSAEVLFLNPAKLIADIKPKDTDLQQ